ncbi:NACHT domain-containing protein [Streptomyces sp. NPDC002911]
MTDVSPDRDKRADGTVNNEISGGTFTGSVTQVGTQNIHTNVYGSPVRSPEAELADQVKYRWQPELAQRGLVGRKRLPVRWTTARDSLMDHWENICEVPLGQKAVPLVLDGNLRETATIAAVYRTVPTRRLVVLGEAGSGKSSLSLLLVLELLNNPWPDEPVPKIFSLGSWNPKEPLEEWLSGLLIRDHPNLARPTADGRTLAAELVNRQRVLPVLDGFDEIAKGLRAKALKRLSRSDMPLILTSRTGQYTSAMEGTLGLERAAAIRLTALAPEDLAEGLESGSAKVVTPEWKNVLARLNDPADARATRDLRRVLTTPLMVALARDIYRERAGGKDRSRPEGARRSPNELLRKDRFSTPESIEEHLLSNFVPSVYEDDRISQKKGASGGTAPGRKWDPERAEHWLGYLAEHLNGRPDLTWWELGTSMSLRARTAVIAFLAGLAFAVTTAIGNIPVNLVATSYELGFAIRRGLVVGLMHGLVWGLALGYVYWRADGADLLKPRPVRARLFTRDRQPDKGFSHKVVLGSLLGFGIALAIVLMDRLLLPPLGLDDGLGGGLVAAAQFPLTVGLSAGIAMALMAWLETPIKWKKSPSCADLLRENRANVISHLLGWALVCGLVAGLGATFTETPLRSLQLGLVFGIEGAFGAGLGYGLCLTAWGQWVALARIWLPLTRRLPWRLVAFLEDACDRDVLRRAGAVYQFRHARLQDHLRVRRDLSRRAGPR